MTRKELYNIKPFIRTESLTFEEKYGLSKTERRELETDRLVELAKATGSYIPYSEKDKLGVRNFRMTEESVVLLNPEKQHVYKLKDPYAKCDRKNIEPEDVIYEHYIHNLLFPETSYNLVGITMSGRQLRLILRQDFVESIRRPTHSQIRKALRGRGLKPEGNGIYGNDHVSVTDVNGDNALLGENGKVYFIDPTISCKKPMKQVIMHLVYCHVPEQKAVKPQTFSARAREYLSVKRKLMKMPKTDMEQVIMDDGSKTTAASWLETQSTVTRMVHECAIHKCLDKGIPLHAMNIQFVARELTAWL